MAIAASTLGGRAVNQYNPPLPPSDQRIGNRAKNPITETDLFALSLVLFYDSRGNPRGLIDLSRPDRKNYTQLSYGGERMIRLPSREWKRAYDAFSVYLMNRELASGLILEKDLNIKPQMPSPTAPPPCNKGQTEYTMTGATLMPRPRSATGSR